MFGFDLLHAVYRHRLFAHMRLALQYIEYNEREWSSSGNGRERKKCCYTGANGRIMDMFVM